MEFLGSEGSFVAVAKDRAEFSAATTVVRAIASMARAELRLKEYVHEDIAGTIAAMDMLLDSPRSSGDQSDGDEVCFRVGDAFGGVVRAAIEAFILAPELFEPYMPPEAMAEAKTHFMTSTQ